VGKGAEHKEARTKNGGMLINSTFKMRL